MDNSWYGVKENIEPLIKGRSVSKLEASITGKPLCDKESKRAAFEEKILLDDGVDPLKNWVDFIDWIEQAYPEGGKDSRLNDVVKDCVRRFLDDSRYSEDERFLDVIFKYIKHLSEPLEMFNALYEKRLFQSLAKFYIEWSWYLEFAGNFKDADNVLDKGLLIGANPKDDILIAQKQLETRITRKVVANDIVSAAEAEEQRRQALVGLKFKSKKSMSIAPVERVANVVKSAQQGLKSSSIATKKTNVIPKIYIEPENRNDENENPTATSSKTTLVENGKENEMKPGKWSSTRLAKQRPVVKPREDFVIYEEEDADEICPNEKTIQEDVLKVRKRNLDSPPLVKFESLAANQKFFCDLNQIYVGGTEYSFEEIRYKKWLANQRKMQAKRSYEDTIKMLMEKINKMEEKEREREEKDKEREQQEKITEQKRVEVETIKFELEDLKKQIASLHTSKSIESAKKSTQDLAVQALEESILKLEKANDERYENKSEQSCASTVFYCSSRSSLSTIKSLPVTSINSAPNIQITAPTTLNSDESTVTQTQNYSTQSQNRLISSSNKSEILALTSESCNERTLESAKIDQTTATNSEISTITDTKKSSINSETAEKLLSTLSMKSRSIADAITEVDSSARRKLNFESTRISQIETPAQTPFRDSSLFQSAIGNVSKSTLRESTLQSDSKLTFTESTMKASSKIPEEKDVSVSLFASTIEEKTLTPESRHDPCPIEIAEPDAKLISFLGESQTKGNIANTQPLSINDENAAPPLAIDKTVNESNYNHEVSSIVRNLWNGSDYESALDINNTAGNANVIVSGPCKDFTIYKDKTFETTKNLKSLIRLDVTEDQARIIDNKENDENSEKINSSNQKSILALSLGKKSKESFNIFIDKTMDESKKGIDPIQTEQTDDEKENQTSKSRLTETNVTSEKGQLEQINLSLKSAKKDVLKLEEQKENGNLVMEKEAVTDTVPEQNDQPQTDNQPPLPSVVAKKNDDNILIDMEIEKPDSTDPKFITPSKSGEESRRKSILSTNLRNVTKLSTIAENSREYKSSSSTNPSATSTAMIVECTSPIDMPPPIAPSRPSRISFPARADLDLGELSIDPLIHRGSCHFRISEAFTMLIPNSEEECLPKSCSTPDSKQFFHQ